MCDRRPRYEMSGVPSSPDPRDAAIIMLLALLSAAVEHARRLERHVENLYEANRVASTTMNFAAEMRAKRMLKAERDAHALVRKQFNKVAAAKVDFNFPDLSNLTGLVAGEKNDANG